MKKLFYRLTYFHILLFLTVINAFADTTVSGPIASDTTWALSGSPYIVIGDVEVMDGATLTIESGVEVKFDGWYKLETLQEATLYAVGNSSSPIIFTSNKSIPKPGDWHSLILQGESTLKFCRVEYAVFNISVYRSSSAIIENCIINNSSQSAITVNESSSVSIKYNSVVNNSTGGSNGAGIGVYDVSPEISNNAIVNNSRGINLLFLDSGTPTIKNNTIFGNNKYSKGPYDILYCDNCTQVDNPLETDATFNYWGQVTTSEMENEGCNSNIENIYDWHDDFHSGIVDYCNWLSSPNLNSPVSPPTGFKATVQEADSNKVILNWNTNPESDIAGYQVYYDINSVRPYKNVVNVGNVNSHILTGLSPGTYYFTVTAYDINANGLGDMYEGYESWYANEKEVIIGEVDIGINPIPDIKANSSDGPITINQGDLLTVTVSVDPGSYDGENADWWAVSYNPSSGWSYYDLSSGWINIGENLDNLSATYQGPLFELSPYELLKTSELPPVTHEFYFGFDTNMNGVLDFGELHFDQVVVEINQKDPNDPPDECPDDEDCIDDALIGKWLVISINGIEFQPGVTQTYDITADTWTVTGPIDCQETDSYTISGNMITLTVKNLLGNDCGNQIGEQFKIEYSINGDTLTIIAPDEDIGPTTVIAKKIK